MIERAGSYSNQSFIIIERRLGRLLVAEFLDSAKFVEDNGLHGDPTRLIALRRFCGHIVLNTPERTYLASTLKVSMNDP